MRLLSMVYLVLIYALIYTLGEFVSRRIGLPHSVTFAGLAVFINIASAVIEEYFGGGMTVVFGVLHMLSASVLIFALLDLLVTALVRAFGIGETGESVLRFLPGAVGVVFAALYFSLWGELSAVNGWQVVGTVSASFGKFAIEVGKAGGGWKGFLSVLGKSPAVWFAVAAAVIAGTVALADYVSGAKQAREALQGMEDTAKQWKNTDAETFYGNSEGLSFFGLSESDFVRDQQSAQDWLDGLLAVWSDGEKESNEIVAHWTDSFKSLTDSTRTELQALKETADKNGYTSVSEGLAADIQTLDQMDAEIERLLKKRQNPFFPNGKTL